MKSENTRSISTTSVADISLGVAIDYSLVELQYLPFLTGQVFNKQGGKILLRSDMAVYIVDNRIVAENDAIAVVLYSGPIRTVRV
ncbi:MAG: hypothetical protein ABI479_04050 [Gallionella sp.]